MKLFVTIGVFVALALYAHAEETKDSTSTVSPAVITAASKSGVSNDGGYKFPMLPTSGYGAALAVGSGVVVGALVLLVIAAVVGPLYSFRLCQVFRTCDSPAGSASYAPDYSEYPAPGTPYNFGYQKRSTEYVGPILQVLKAAYEKYGHGSGPTGLNSKNINSE